MIEVGDSEFHHKTLTGRQADGDFRPIGKRLIDGKPCTWTAWEAVVIKNQKSSTYETGVDEFNGILDCLEDIEINVPPGNWAGIKPLKCLRDESNVEFHKRVGGQQGGNTFG